MSVTVELYEYDESMDDDVLSSMGVKSGLLGQLTHDVDIEDETELLQNTESHTVGSSNYEFPRRVMDEMQGVTEVDSIFISTVETIVDELADSDEGRYDADSTVEWIREREGEQIFVKGL